MDTKIRYRNLPEDFWNTVVFYDYYISFSGFEDTWPYITLWTTDGKVYCINTCELQDGHFERVIPFFESMTNREKRDKGDLFYFNWELVPKGWKYYYHQSNHCFMPEEVYEEFCSQYEKIDNSYKEFDIDNESVQQMIVRFTLWKIILKKAFQTILGIEISRSEETYITFDEER